MSATMEGSQGELIGEESGSHEGRRELGREWKRWSRMMIMI
jgi:hypothetical protein